MGNGPLYPSPGINGTVLSSNQPVPRSKAAVIEATLPVFRMILIAFTAPPIGLSCVSVWSQGKNTAYELVVDTNRTKVARADKYLTFTVTSMYFSLNQFARLTHLSPDYFPPHQLSTASRKLSRGPPTRPPGRTSGHARGSIGHPLLGRPPARVASRVSRVKRADREGLAELDFGGRAQRLLEFVAAGLPARFESGACWMRTRRRPSSSPAKRPLRGGGKRRPRSSRRPLTPPAP